MSIEAQFAEVQRSKRWQREEPWVRRRFFFNFFRIIKITHPSATWKVVGRVQRSRRVAHA